MAFAKCRPFRREKLVFKLLGADNAGVAADGWAALHFQDIAYRIKQMEGEADFAVAPGLGVLAREQECAPPPRHCHTCAAQQPSLRSMTA